MLYYSEKPKNRQLEIYVNKMKKAKLLGENEDSSLLLEEASFLWNITVAKKNNLSKRPLNLTDVDAEKKWDQLILTKTEKLSAKELSSAKILPELSKEEWNFAVNRCVGYAISYALQLNKDNHEN